MAALFAAGCSVQDLHKMGGGVPDLAVGRDGVTYFLEVKQAANLRGDPKPLTPDQVEWHRMWRGQVAIVTTAEDALRVVGLLPQQQFERPYR